MSEERFECAGEGTRRIYGVKGDVVLLGVEERLWCAEDGVNWCRSVEKGVEWGWKMTVWCRSGMVIEVEAEWREG